jgi:hypothetical protein
MRLLNKYRDEIPREAVSIMRPGPFGNPFIIGRDGTRAECVAKHLVYARRRLATHPQFRAALEQLAGRDLVCCCAPRPCHGDNLILICEELAAERARRAS